MSTKGVRIVSFLKQLMQRRKRLPSQLATDLGVSHATVSRWLSGEDAPNPRSCQKPAEYSGTPPDMVLSIAGHLIRENETVPVAWPEFREYARQKYTDELVEDLIERRRLRRYGRKHT